MCEIGLCIDDTQQTGYLTEDSTKTMWAGTTIDINNCNDETNPCTVADYRILLNKPGIKRINGTKSTASNDGNYIINCEAEYSCNNKKDSNERPGILTSNVESTWKNVPTSKAYNSSGKPYKWGPSKYLMGNPNCFINDDGSFNYTTDCKQYL